MPVSKDVLDGLDLTARVDTVVDQCYDSWRIAVVAALSGFNAPADTDADRQFWIAVAGDLLWAVVVFAPEVGAVVKAASMIGATLGSELAAKLKSSPKFIASGEGKNWLTTQFFQMADLFADTIRPIVPNWCQSELLPAILDRASDDLGGRDGKLSYKLRKDEYLRKNPHLLKPVGFFLENQDLLDWVRGIQGRSFVNSFIWNNLLIGPRTIRYEHRDVDLLIYFQRLLAELQDQFELYQEIREYNLRHAAAMAKGDISDKAKAVEEYADAHPFQFTPYTGFHLSASKF